MAVGFEQMDIVAVFSAPAGGWEALAARRSPCYFGVRLRLGGRGAGHAVWIQSHCNNTVGADREGCAALGHVSARRMDQVFRNGAGAAPARAAELTLDTGDTTNGSGVPLGTLFGGTRLLGGPLVLPLGGGALEMRVLVDRSLIEAFASGAKAVFWSRSFPCLKRPFCQQDGPSLRYEHSETLRGYACCCVQAEDRSADSRRG